MERAVRRRMKVECRVTHDHVAIWTLGPEPVLLATHERACRKGAWVINRDHWDGLRTPPGRPTCRRARRWDGASSSPVWARIPKAATPVARRDLATYDAVGRVA